MRDDVLSSDHVVVFIVNSFSREVDCMERRDILRLVWVKMCGKLYHELN
jgi:hypothetical protein